MKIGSRSIGAGWPAFVIAEAGVNHDGDVERAKLLIDAASDAGADAVKFQSFSAASVASADAPKAPYQVARTGAEGSQLQMLRRLELSPAAHRDLSDHARGRGIVFCSTPFDLASVDLLEQLGVPFFKIASGEITHVPLLRRIGSTGKPIVLSTGMADEAEIETALATLRAAGAQEIALLHCVSEYPAPVAEANLRAIESLRRRFGTPVGYSDHTLGLEAAVAAVVLGACIVEKHLTLDRNAAGPDHRASLEPQDFLELVRQIRSVESAMGDGIKRPTASELANRVVTRRGLFAAVDIGKGTVVTPELVVCKRPSDGIEASHFDAVIGRRARRDLVRGQKLTWEHLD